MLKAGNGIVCPILPTDSTPRKIYQAYIVFDKEKVHTSCKNGSPLLSAAGSRLYYPFS